MNLTDNFRKFFITFTAKMVPDLMCRTFSTTPYAPLPKIQRLSKSSASTLTSIPAMVMVVRLSNGWPWLSTGAGGGLMVMVVKFESRK